MHLTLLLLPKATVDTEKKKDKKQHGVHSRRDVNVDVMTCEIVSALH